MNEIEAFAVEELILEAWNAYYDGQYERATHVGEQAAKAAYELQMPRLEWEAYFISAICQMNLKNHERGLSLSARAITALELTPKYELPSPEKISLTFALCSESSANAGLPLSSIRPVLDAGRSLLKQMGADDYLLWLEHLWSKCLVKRGDIERSLIVSEEVLSLKRLNPSCDGCKIDCYYETYISALIKAGLVVKALALIEEAIAQSPESIELLGNRAAVLYELGNYKAAIDDYTTVIMAEPSVHLYRFRAMAWAQMGQKDRALNDFRASWKLDTSNKFSSLWRVALEDPEVPFGYLANDSAWPSPLFVFFAGQMTQEELLKQASDETKSSESLCEAYGFLGLWAEQKDNSSVAVEFYKKAVETNQTTYDEYKWAKGRLKQLHITPA